MHQPHAVIVLPNDIQIDARAHRNGIALAAAGYRVTIVGYGVTMPPTGTIAGVPYILCAPPGKQAAAKKPPTLLHRVVRKTFHVAGGRRPPQKVLQAVAGVEDLASRTRRAVTRGIARPTAPAPAVTADAEPIRWRTALPHITTMIDAMFDTVISLRPDVLVTDVHLMPLIVQAKDRLHIMGHHVGLVYDAREYVYGLASDDRMVTEGFPDLEAEFMDRMDDTFTVCEPIARFLKDKYDLPAEPRLVPNSPIYHLPEVERPMTIRDFLDVPAEAPLLAYAGGLSHHRGVHDVVVALAELPGVHLALGARRGSSYTVELEALADRHGVGDRVHFVPFAPGHEVAEYLASATAAIFPFLPVGNHVWAAPNKYFEAVQARLPVITSNMEWLSEQVTRLGIGEVFEHSNPASAAEAIRTVLADIDSYRARITDEVVAEHSFEHFVHVVQEVCEGATLTRSLKGLRPESFEEQLPPIRLEMLKHRASLADAELFESRPWLHIGNTNSAGQPRLWALSLMRQHPEAIADSSWLQRDTTLRFPVDMTISSQQWVLPAWHRHMLRKLENRVTHVLSESGRPVVGTKFGQFFHDETAALRDLGIAQGLVFHGSDIRNPAGHAEREPESPYTDPDNALTATLQARVDALMPHVDAFEGPVHVTTLDLLDYLPGATWLPLVVESEFWHCDSVPMQHNGAPVVFHVPSKANGVKGSDAVDEVCQRLHHERRIRYFRAEGLTRAEMRERMLAADIVIDQLRIGDYGVTAVEGMAAGKVVIGHVSDRVRARLEDEIPVVQATANTLRYVLVGLLEERERAVELSAAGRAFVATYHDGRRSAAVLADFMGL